MNKTILIIAITIVSLALGGIIGLYFGEQKGYNNGWQAADKRLEETGMISPLMKDKELKIINGKVESVEGNTIKISMKPLHPLDDPDLDIRIIEVDESTEMLKPTEIKSDVAPEGSVIKKIPVDISAIEPGQFVLINTEENVRYIKQFKANLIVIMSSPK